MVDLSNPSASSEIRVVAIRRIYENESRTR
jgi:hypothetical protein